MSSKKILVTGGSGFIGSALVRRLVARGYSTTVFDNNFRGTAERLADVADRIDIIEGDIRSREEVVKATTGMDTVFHLAFINGTKYFYQRPDLVLDVGVKGAVNTVEAALECGIAQYILASSSEVYQQPTHIPTTEEERILIPDVRNPRYSYGGGKIISELLTINMFRETAVSHQIFRPHNIFGPQMGFEHVIPELVRKITEGTNGFKDQQCRIEIQGTGEETRAFCYVEDAVDQLIFILEKGKSGEIYHIGMEEEITIRQLIEDIGQALGVRIEVSAGELRSGGTSRRCPSIRKVCSLGYKPENHYRTGLKKTVDWYREYFMKEMPIGT
ncbi:MAG: SDR family NAD(P)-dependent oxidoreductase [Candidatus Omnitrophica bacterium]|nr:SDR family NAD(P)-dependent oxidoreductase [Candidatus Omnitrophota bacterium]